MNTRLRPINRLLLSLAMVILSQMAHDLGQPNLVRKKSRDLRGAMEKEDSPCNLEAGAAAPRENLPEMGQPGAAQSQGAEDNSPEDVTGTPGYSLT